MNILTTPLWGEKRCTEIAERIKASDRAHWIDRGHFWTLGAATYQDDPMNYPALAEKHNPYLWEVFGKEQEDVLNALEEVLGISGYHRKGTALPSFHIFDHRASGMVGHPHIDEPHLRVWWPSKVTNTFSFTVLLEAPQHGAGLDIWHDYSDLEVELFEKRGVLPEPDYFAYDLGRLVIHDGLTPHRIANPAPQYLVEQGEWRISLQGHGATLENGLTALYF